MNVYFSVIAFLLFTFSYSLVAQTQSPGAKSPAVTEPAAHLAKQNVVAAKSSQNQNNALAEMQRRARLVAEKNIQFIKDVKAAKVVPFAQLREQYTEVFALQLASLQSQYEAIQKEHYPPARKRLVEGFRKALQPMGPYLNSADYQLIDMALTAPQLAELKRLQLLDPRTQIGAPSLPEMRSLSSQQTFTMLHIPVYLKAKAQPGATVYFSTGGGGQFENGLSMQAVKANDQGVAETSWVSHGDSIGLCNIIATSPESSSPVTFKVEVIGLSLRALPQLVGVRPTPDHIKQAAELIKQKQQSLQLKSKPSPSAR